MSNKRNKLSEDDDDNNLETPNSPESDASQLELRQKRRQETENIDVPEKQKISSRLKSPFKRRAAAEEEKEEEEELSETERQKQLIQQRREAERRKQKREDSETEDSYVKSLFGKCCQNMFPSSSEEKSEEQQVELVLAELCFYLCFVALTTFVAFYTVSPNMYFMTRSIKKALIDSKFYVNGIKYQYMDIHEPGEVFDFIEKKIDPIVAGKTRQKQEDFGFENSLDNEDRNPFTESKVVLNPIIRMIPVQPNTCMIHPLFKEDFDTCYPYYDKADDIDHSGSFDQTKQGNSWNWQKLNSSVPYSGVISTYNVYGYVIKFGTSVKSKVTKLKKSIFIGRYTRVVFLDLVVYNPSVNLFCFIKFVFEQPPTGGILPTYELRTLKLFGTVNKMDHFVFGCQLAIIVFLIIFTAEEIFELIFYSYRFLWEFWNYIDLTIIVIFWYYEIMSLLAGVSGVSILQDINKNQEVPENKINRAVKANDALALGMFFVWCKLFKYVFSIEGMGNLSKSIKQCFWILFNFIVVFFVVFVGFAIVGHAWFGRQAPDYQTITTSCLTLIRIILSDLDYKQIDLINPYLAFVFFSCYVLFVIFILLNIFVAILNESYTVIKNEGSVDPKRVTIWSYLTGPIKRSLAITRRESDLIVNENALSIVYLKELFRKHNFTDTEIFSFLCKYNLEQTKYVTEEKMQSLCAEMEAVFFNPLRPADHRAAAKMDMVAIKQAKDKVEQSNRNKTLGLVLKNFDQLLVRVNNIDMQLEFLAERLLEILNTLEKSGKDIFIEESEIIARKKNKGKAVKSGEKSLFKNILPSNKDKKKPPPEPLPEEPEISDPDKN